MTLSVHRSVSRLNFLKGGKLHFYGPIGVLVNYFFFNVGRYRPRENEGDKEKEGVRERKRASDRDEGKMYK